MQLANSTYIPTLAIRASEMNGLEQLPSLTKDRLYPLFLLAPWATSHSLEKSIERIERAFPNRPYFLDLDRDYSCTNMENPAQAEFATLFNHENSYANWCEFYAMYSNIRPCIQLNNQNADDFLAQITHAQNQNREFCVRLRYNHIPDNLEKFLETLNKIGTADYSIILEGGWTADSLTLSSWFLGLITESLAQIDASVPIIISCTSMLKDYSNIEGNADVTFTNRELVSQIASQTNRGLILYGDWGSTRPRDNSTGGQRPLDRIDYPKQNSWFISRSKENGWDFNRAAKEVVGNDDVWEGDLGIWGEQMIMQTSINPALAINTPQKNVAARVNIHLHRQAFFGVDGIQGMNFDEDWQD